MNKLLYILAIAILLAYAIIRTYKLRNIRCSKCGGKMELNKLEDPMGINPTKRITFSLYRGPRKYKEIWKCISCGNKIERNYWGS